jgi:hypothetical protein
MSLFEKGRAKTGGRRKGVKDRIGTMFLEELAKDFEEHGAEVIKIARIERPVEYLKIVSATLPKEFEITDSRLEEISDGVAASRAKSSGTPFKRFWSAAQARSALVPFQKTLWPN